MRVIPAEPKRKNSVFVGYVPGKLNLAGKKFETGWHRDLSGAEYSCIINGGKNRYFYIQERRVIKNMPGSSNELGDILKTFHYNQAEGAELAEEIKMIENDNL